MHRLVIAGLLTAAGLVFVTAAAAAPGDLDGTFGVGGVVRTDVGGWDAATDLAVQPDGKVVAAGTVDWNGTRNVFVARYLANGALDPGFGSGGIVVPNRYHQVAPRLALQPDGKIVLATRGESAGGPVFLYRFGANGTPDEGFGSSSTGTASMPSPTGVSIASVAGVSIASGGEIVVAVRASLFSGKGVVGLARFNGNGTPDGSFGQAGFVSAERSSTWLPLSFVLEPDGRMLVCGYAAPSPGRFFLDAFVARFTADGALDTSFDADGIALVQRPSNGTEFQALGVAADGSILTGGTEFGSTFGQNQWLLAKFTSAGVLDPDFGSAGLSLYDPGTGNDVILDLAATPAGIYVTGWTDSLSLGLPVARFGDDGNLDPNFGVGGLVGLSGQFTRGAWRLGVQTDGKVIVFGTLTSFVPTFNVDLYLARYEGGPTDTDPPMLTLPSVVPADATSPDGAVVDYASLVSATDEVDPNPVVSCAPPSGSMFPIGDTSVSCTATDAAGNSSSGSFTVHVKGASEQVADLLALVDSYQLDKLGTSLQDKLVTVQQFLAAGKPRQAEENLAAFVAQVTAQRGKALTEEQADALETAALRIIDVIET